MAMAKLSYHRLKQEIWSSDEDDIREHVIGRLRNSSRFRGVNLKKKLRVKIPRLKILLRRKTSSVKIAWSKICRRLKESQAHFGELFAGNYLFTQVTPTSLKLYADNGKSFVKGNDFHGLSSSRYYAPRSA